MIDVSSISVKLINCTSAVKLKSTSVTKAKKIHLYLEERTKVLMCQKEKQRKLF